MSHRRLKIKGVRKDKALRRRGRERVLFQLPVAFENDQPQSLIYSHHQSSSLARLLQKLRLHLSGCARSLFREGFVWDGPQRPATPKYGLTSFADSTVDPASAFDPWLNSVETFERRQTMVRCLLFSAGSYVYFGAFAHAARFVSSSQSGFKHIFVFCRPQNLYLNLNLSS